MCKSQGMYIYNKYILYILEFIYIHENSKVYHYYMCLLKILSTPAST